MKKQLFAKVVAGCLGLAQVMTLLGCQSTTTPTASMGEEQGRSEVKLESMALSALPDTYTSKVSYAGQEFKPQVDQPELKSDFSNVVNFEQFSGFTQGQLEMLRKNGFVVMRQDSEYPYLKMHQVYEGAEYANTPLFISTDAVLNLYHIFYSEGLKGLESSDLQDALKGLSTILLKESLSFYEDPQYEAIKEQLKTIVAYYTVACSLMGEEIEVPTEIRAIADEEIVLIEAVEGVAQSPLLNKNMDYSQYILRGHYTSTETLGRYFKTMMWYGQVGFQLTAEEDKASIEHTEVNIENAQLATMMSMIILNNPEAIKLWDQVYTATSIYVGTADDLTLYDFEKLIETVYGPNVNLLNVVDASYTEALKEAIKALPEPQIVGKVPLTPDTVKGKQFRVMGQRYTLDADIMQQLMEPIKRPVPSGLDVMAALGSNRAKTLVDTYYAPSKKWTEYETILNKLKLSCGELKGEDWQGNLYSGWLWTIQSAAQSFENTEGMPNFMRSAAWTDKNLQTALGSYTELKHDTVLYSKQACAEMGGPLFNMPYIYVEPNVEVYTKLLGLIENTQKSLKSRQLMNEETAKILDRMAEHIKVLETCAIKELTNQNFTAEEYEQLTAFGGLVDSISYEFANMNLAYDEATSDTYTSALVSDVATILDVHQYLELGSGIPYKIYAICPYKGKLFLAEGALFSYYEFLSDERLTDEKWHEILGIEKTLNEDYGYETIKVNQSVAKDKLFIPEWTASFVSKEPNHVERTGVEVIWDDAMLPNNPAPGPDGEYDY